jgi:SRSO17 transposase
MKKDIVDALVSIGGKFEIKNTYSTLVWKDDVIPKPTKAEIDAEIIRLQAEYDVQAYSRNRQAEYPSVQECVHAILDNTLDALQAKRASVKLKYPKGG